MNNVDNPFESPAILSICPGILGLERGLIRAIGSVRTIAYVEIETFAVENILAGMEAGILAPAPIWSNLKTFDPRPFCGKVDGILGGYPCPPFSTAGKRGGAADPRHLWPYIENCFNAIRPIWGWFENVGGHLSLGFDTVYKSLARMGYAVETGIFTAEEVGAPHKRERIFILAVAHSYRNAARGRSGDIRSPQGSGPGKAQQRERVRAIPGHDGQKMANPYSDRSGSGNERIGRETRTNVERGSIWAIMAYNAIQGLEGRPEQSAWEEQPSAERSDSPMAYAPGGPAIGGCGSVRQTDGRSVARGDAESYDPGGELAYADHAGFQELGQHGEPAETQDHRTSDPDVSTQYPAGPGSAQHEWESPRTIGKINRLPSSIRKLWHQVRPDFEKIVGKKIWTETDRNIKAAIEPGLGCRIDGYNFREDLLRALGNSVVEQQAEYAWKILFKKHFPQ